VKGVGSTCCQCAAKALGEIDSGLGDKLCGFCGSDEVLLGSADNESVITTLGSAGKGSAEKNPGEKESAEATCEFSVKDACNDSPPAQKAACLVALSRDVASEAIKLGFPTPVQKHTIVTPKGDAVTLSQHELGCSFWDVKCHFNSMKCSLCKKAIPALVKMGSQPVCDAGCVAGVEAIGGGPEDPVADALAVACPILCSQVFKAGASHEAGAVCSATHLC